MLHGIPLLHGCRSTCFKSVIQLGGGAYVRLVYNFIVGVAGVKRARRHAGNARGVGGSTICVVVLVMVTSTLPSASGTLLGVPDYGSGLDGGSISQVAAFHLLSKVTVKLSAVPAVKAGVDLCAVHAGVADHRIYRCCQSALVADFVAGQIVGA